MPELERRLGDLNADDTPVHRSLHERTSLSRSVSTPVKAHSSGYVHRREGRCNLAQTSVARSVLSSESPLNNARRARACAVAKSAVEVCSTPLARFADMYTTYRTWSASAGPVYTDEGGAAIRTVRNSTTQYAQSS